MKDILKPALILSLFCAVIVGLLATVNLMTRNKIEEMDLKNTETSMRDVMEDGDSFTKKNGKNGSYYIAKNKDDNVAGYVFITESAGYGSPVSVMTGIDRDGSITGVKILSSDETPGLGKKVENSAFTDQYKGKRKGVTASKTGGGENEIRIVTGATITSNSVTKSVNLALKQFFEEGLYE